MTRYIACVVGTGLIINSQGLCWFPVWESEAL